MLREYSTLPWVSKTNLQVVDGSYLPNIQYFFTQDIRLIVSMESHPHFIFELEVWLGLTQLLTPELTIISLMYQDIPSQWPWQMVQWDAHDLSCFNCEVNFRIFFWTRNKEALSLSRYWQPGGSHKGKCRQWKEDKGIRDDTCKEINQLLFPMYKTSLGLEHVHLNFYWTIFSLTLTTAYVFSNLGLL